MSRPDLEHGDLAEADKHVGQARAWLDQADSYLNSIVALEANLRAAKSAAVPPTSTMPVLKLISLVNHSKFVVNSNLAWKS